MRKIVIALTALAVLGMFATSSFAAVNYDPETGGFVGKGDVQTVFGWNNKALQDNAHLVRFQYSDEIVVEGGQCINPNTGAAHPNDVWQRTTGLEAEVVYDARTKEHITGFLLEDVGSGDPVYTDSCGGNRTEGPGSIISTQPGAGLEVSHDGVNWFALPNTP